MKTTLHDIPQSDLRQFPDRLIRNKRRSKEKLAGCARQQWCRMPLPPHRQRSESKTGLRPAAKPPSNSTALGSGLPFLDDKTYAGAGVGVGKSSGRSGSRGRSNSRADLRPEVPDTPAVPTPSRQSLQSEAEIDGEVARLRAENDRLRQLLEKGDGAPWTSVLFLELERESYEQQRILCLKRELCMALQRRRRLEQAVRAGHASLERALYGALSQEGASLQALEQAFVDGTAAAEADLAEEAMLLDADAAPKQPGRRAPSPAHTPSSASAAGAAKATSSRRLWEAAEIYQLEQAVFQAASSLMAFAEASGEAWADQLAARLQTLSWQLLRARELPVTSADVDASTAAVRRRLWRFMAGRSLAKCRDQPSEGVHSGPEVASSEKELRTEVEQAVASMLELAEPWLASGTTKKSNQLWMLIHDLRDLWDRIIVRCTPSHLVAKVQWATAVLSARAVAGAAHGGSRVARVSELVLAKGRVSKLRSPEPNSARGRRCSP